MPDWLRTAAELNAAEQIVQTVTTEQQLSPEQTPVATAETVLPDWLGETPATPTEAPPQDTATAPTETLPDWLSQGHAAAETTPAPEPAPEPTATPDWASELQTNAVAPTETKSVETETVRASTKANALPDWLQESNASETPADLVAANAEPQTAPAPKPEPTSKSDKPPDALTLIANARARNQQGDLKGALDMYERAMHRRPNHLDTVIADLQQLVQNPATPATAHRLLGEAFAMAGRFKESLEQYRLAMEK